MKKHSAATKYLSLFLSFVMLMSSPGAALADGDMLYEEEYVQTEEASEVEGGGSAQEIYDSGTAARESYEAPAEDVETGYEVAGSGTGDLSPYVENAQQTGSENGSGTDSGTGANTGSGSDSSSEAAGASGTGSGSGTDSSSGTGVSGSADGSQTGSGSGSSGTSVVSPVVTWRSITTEAKPAVLYEGVNQVTDDFLKAQAIWPYLYNRDLTYELSEQVRNADGTLIRPGTETSYDYGYESNGLFSNEGSYLNLYDTNGETRPLIIEVAGVLPSDVTAEARYIDFGRTGIDGTFRVNSTNNSSQGKRYEESALAAVFVTLKDSNGNTYIPTGDLFIAAGGSIVNDAARETSEGASLLVYEYEEDVEHEQQLGRYAASVAVHKNISDSNTRTLYGRGMSGNEVNFYESVHNLSQYVNNTISFDADRTSLSFVISGQLPEKSLAPDEEISGENGTEVTEDYLDESGAYGFNSDEINGNFNPDEVNGHFNADEVNGNFNANDINGDVVVYDSVTPTDGQGGDASKDDQNSDGADSNPTGGQDVAAPGLDLDGDGIYDVLYGRIEDRDPIGRPADENGGNEAAGEKGAADGTDAAEGNTADGSDTTATGAGTDSPAESDAAVDADGTDAADSTAAADGKDASAGTAADGNDTAKDAAADGDHTAGEEITEEMQAAEDTAAADVTGDENSADGSASDNDGQAADGFASGDKDNTAYGSDTENGDGFHQLTASGDNYEVSVTYGQDANVPAGAELQAEELSQGNGENSELVSQAADALGASESDIVSVTLLDLSILKDGEVVEPDSDVDVKVQVNGAYADPNTEYQVVSLGTTNEVLDGTVTEDAVDYETSAASMDPVYAIVERLIHVETNYKDCAGDTWRVSVDYDANAGIPEGAQLVVRELTDEEYAEYIAQSAELLGVAPEEVHIDKALDITLVKDGVEYHELNNGVNVSIELLDTEVTDDMQVLHMGETPENMYAYPVDNTLNFVADGFSVFVITRVVKVLTLDASDGNTYKVTVTYDTTCGIPQDAELVVSKIKEGDAGYEEYLEKSARILGETTDALELARPFDITLKNPETGELYQPNKDVLVTIELLDEELAGYDDVNVVHIHGEEEEQIEVLDLRLSGEVVEFETSGFSVFVVVYTVDFHWGDYTYSIAGESAIRLSELFEKLGVREIALADVAEVSFSNPEYIEIEQAEGDWLLKSLAPFDTEEALTLTLVNGESVQIVVTDEGGSTDPAITVPPTAKEGLVYNGQEQALVVEGTVDEGVTFSYALGENSETAPVDIEGEDSKWSESIPTATDAGTYYVWYKVEGSDPTAPCLTVTVAQATFDPSVTMRAGDYDAGNNTITYTVTVKAKGNSFYEADHPVTITSDPAGLTFRSGSYTYAHSQTLPEGSDESRVNDGNISAGEASFDGFPLTVGHMYDGDTLTLTYTAEVNGAVYDASEGVAKVKNTVTITPGIAPDERNIITDTENDAATVTTSSIPCTPLKREYLTLDGSWAYWRVIVNPDGYTIGGGNNLTLLDTFDDKVDLDAGQSIDYSSINVEVNSQPDTAGIVTYDYSSSTGTFIIPDSKPVTITYRTRITAQPGEAALFRGTAVLKDSSENTIATSTAGVIDEAVAIYPSPSDVTGSGNYMVKLYVYADGQMQRGIEGAQFILLDANQRPLEYKRGDNKDQPVTFITGSDGYVNIELHEEDGDVSIEKNTTYYLEMIQAVAGYQKDNTLYGFTIKDDPDYSNYEFHNGDTMKVRLYPASPGLSVSIRFSGSYSLRDDQKNGVTAVLQRRDEQNNWIEVERHPYTDSQWGSIAFDETLYDANLGVYQNWYRVVVENEEPWDLPDGIIVNTTYYCLINTGTSDPETDPQEFSVDSTNDSVSVVIDNRYEESQLTIIKMNKQTGEVLPGAEFSVYQIVNGSQTGESVKTYTTDDDGELVIRGGEPFASEVLYGITETKAPEGYILPQIGREEWHYFYFCNDEYLEPSILANLPEGAEAVNLTTSGDVITVDNKQEVITIPVMKIWQGSSWPGDPEVVVGLYQSFEGVVDEEGNPVVEAVKNNDGTPRIVTLTEDIPYSTAFSGLPSREKDGLKRNITYSIKEESIGGKDPLAAGYNQEYGISSAGVYIVRNKPATTLTVSKEWYDSVTGEKVTDEEKLEKQSSVTFDVYRSTSQFTDSTPDDGVTNADMAAFVSGLVKVREGLNFDASDNWSISINDLEKQNDLGDPYYYYVMETVPSFGNELYELDETTGSVTIKNKIAPETVHLTVTKAALVDDPRPESLEREFEFTLKLNNDHYPIRSWQVYTDEENSDNNLITDWNGEVKFTLKPTNPEQTTLDASITLNLPAGVTATVTESYLSEYTVATSATVDGTTGDNGRTYSYETRSETDTVSLTYTNTLHVICKVVTDDGTELPFESLSRALKYIRENPGSFTSPWVIYLLEDYTIPVTDVINVQEGESLTLTTAAINTEDEFPFKPEQMETDRAVITRGEAGGSMLKNAGTLTLANICLDGGNITATGNGGLVNSSGTLNLNDKTTLRNSSASGKGGAVYAEGAVNIVDGVSITGNSSPSASALYLRGTLNMTGGIITGNTGAADGAVVVENSNDVINFSGSPKIIDNTNSQGKAANLYISYDSDSILNVVSPGLANTAKIGVTAMEGHMLIGEQFATAEIYQTENLNRFVNDAYGYRGKLKDGTSTNIVWDGLTIEINKVVDLVGANANDRFTISLSSPSITMSTYIIDGTLDYTVTAARQGRPGRIVLRNIKASDTITISPLPVGDYIIAEEASNYTPVYTLIETGSNETPEEIEGGSFSAYDDCTVTVTNTRRLADVNLTKTLDDRLKEEDEAQEFGFTVKLTEADGTTPVSGFTIYTDEEMPAASITTDASGEAAFAMSPTNATNAAFHFKAPVGATMTITEASNSNYQIMASAVTMPKEGEGMAITDADTDNSNIFTFSVTDDGADVIFANVREMAEIELRKELTGKVSETESFTFTVTLTRATGEKAVGYIMYRDDSDPTKNIVTDGDGKATIVFDFERSESAKAITLTIPEGTKLEVEETNVNGHTDYYNTTYSVNEGAAQTGSKATINTVSDSYHSIVFTNARIMKSITVSNKVNGYSGNVVPFTYTATVTDGGEGTDDYNENGFTNGVMTFDLTTGQNQTLTVPYGATLTVAQTFIVGYSTTVKRGSAGAVEKLNDTFTVTTDMPASSPLLFTNSQLIGLRLVNNTTSPLENIVVTVEKNNIYRVNSDQTGQERISTNKTATLNIAAGETAILEIQHDTSVTAEQAYSVKGTMPAIGYYYTINNEPSFHEFADPAILRVYDADDFEVKGRLRYSVQDSIVTFTEQPLVSFDVNGGAWTTEMDGYRDRDGDRKVYQMAVTSGEAVSEPSPAPVYPTGEDIAFLGWTTDETFAKMAHTASEDVSTKLYDFDSVVTAPIILYAIWACDPNVRTVTVKNGLNEALIVNVTLTNDDPSGAKYTIFEDADDSANNITTNEDGTVSFALAAGEAKNLHVPNGAKLVLTGSDGIAYSTDFTDADSDEHSFTINSVDKDGTVSFIGGICKITDSAGNILYDNEGKPAVYSTLKAAFTAYVGTLYIDASHTTTATPLAVKMLVDEYTTLETTAISFPNETMTLTTAGKGDTDFPYVGVRDRATIYRSEAGKGDNFFTLATGNITMTNIILDGGSEKGVKIAKDKNGGLINMDKASGVLNIETGTTLRNCEFDAYNTGNQSSGGAICMTNGTLNIYAGLFSNLQARRGGAINVTGGTLNVTGSVGSIRFENCSTSSTNNDNNGGDGGAIFYSAAKNVTINGGENEASPGIVFIGCVAGSNWSDGGAIYATTSKNYDVSIKGCSFTECSARNTTGKNDEGYGGGGIGVQSIKHLEVSQCSFNSCDSLKGGGGVLAHVKNNSDDDSTVSILSCSFLNCSCKAQGGAVAAYTDNNSATASKTKLYINNCTITNCSSGTDNGSGGAIQCYLPRLELFSTQITDCWAGKEGGGINHYFGGSYGQIWPNSSLTLTNCMFTRCRAEDRYEPNALQHYGGGINTKAKTVTVTGSYFEDCVSTLKEGGALHLGGQGTGSKATITGSTFKNCTAKNGGGALLASNEMLEISNCSFYGCSSSASNGGAVYHYRNSRGDSTQKYMTITNSNFSADPNETDGAACRAANNGGAIWTRANTTVTLENLTIDGCSAVNGGGIYLDTASRGVTISGETIGDKLHGSITNCQAASGSAIYVGYSATFSGDLSVTDNTVSNINSGAIHGGTLYFEGNVVVKDNTCSIDSEHDHDVLMQNNNNTTIYTTANGLGGEANIGVYVVDAQVSGHGLEGKPFGTWVEGGSDLLESFFNDRDSDLYGYQWSATDNKIYWGIYVCKITDAEGNTLKRTNGRDAVYQRLTMALDEFTSVKNENGETGKAVYIKMLVEDYHIQQEATITNFPAADITLTTETYTGIDSVTGKYDGKHPYRGTSGTVCTISRDTRYSSSNQLFKLSSAGTTFRMEDITFDGRKDKTATQGNYRLIEATAGKVIVSGGSTFQYGYVNNSHGTAVYVSNANGSLDINSTEGKNVLFEHCYAAGSGNGGAIYATSSLEINSDGKGRTTFNDCYSNHGGAIMVTGNSASIHMTVDGAAFKDCHSVCEGGAVYHDYNNNTATYDDDNHNTAADTTIKNSSFENCYSTGNERYSYGGAIAARTATLTVDTCTFDNCYAQSNGGAINHGLENDNRQRTWILNTTFTDCQTNGTSTSYGYGGSIYTRALNVMVEDGTFQSSTSYNHGGALYCQSNNAASTAAISGTTFENCSVIRIGGYGGAIYSRNKVLTLQKSEKAGTAINTCTASGYSGAVYTETTGSVLNITDSTVISSCYANQGGAIYLPSGVTLNLTKSPEFTQNGYATQNGSIVDADAGACIYLAEGSRINLKDSPKFSRNILPNETRIPNGGVTDFVRQDIYMAGYYSSTELATNAASIYVVGELTGDTIWIWPEQSPHKLANEQFAKIADDVTVSDDSLGRLRNSLSDGVTSCSNGEYLAGVKVGNDTQNVYWDKMYLVSFMKKDNKGVTVPGAGFTLYKDLACTNVVATAVSADGENDTDAYGKLLSRGTVEFSAIRIGAYYMKETNVPTSFRENNATYLVLVGTPYLSNNETSHSLWEEDGPLDVTDAANLVVQHTTNAGRYYGIFPLDENNKAVLRANLASNSVGIQNIRNDYQVAFMKVDGNGDVLPGAAFTIYTAILDSNDQPETFEDGYPQLMLWSRDGENYPAPVISADGTSTYRDKENQTLPKGMVYFRELPIGTYYLLETAYPERNGSGRRAFYAESDRVFRLDVEEDSTSADGVKIKLSEWKQGNEGVGATYEELEKNSAGYYLVSNQEVVCKLTDSSDNLLYVEGHKVWGNKEESSSRLFPAIYATLEEGFEAAQTGSFVYANGNHADVESSIKLKALKDFTLSNAIHPVFYSSDRDITFTTAETRVSKDRYIFSTTRTSDTSRALISRAYDENNSENANVGALITLNNDASLTLQNIRLSGNNLNGRAIHVTDNSSLTIGTNTRIEYFKQEASGSSTDGNDVKGGAILLDDNTSFTINGGYNRTAIFANNQIVNNRVSGSTGSDGGAIAVGKDCTFSITNAQFINNSATAAAEKKGNGGAVSINETKDAEEAMDLQIYNVVFSNNSASYKGGAVRTAENCDLTVSNCTFSSNSVSNSGSEGGAIAVLSKEDATSSLTITNGTVFTGNTADSGGAVKIGGYGMLTLDNVIIRNNTATVNGGAVSAAPGAEVRFTSGTISNNTASANGGAFYVESKVDADTQEVTTGTVLSISGGSITANNASLGSAVYANDYAEITITNASITGNKASGANGGAINVGGPNTRLYFGGTPTVFDNTLSTDTSQQRNLVLSEDNNDIINTTEDGLLSGTIGVFVTESNSAGGEVFEGHGLPGKPFGTFGDQNKRLNPQVFRSDHALALYGVRNEDNPNDDLIYWVDVICKLTDKSDNILYQDINLTINGKTETRKAQAVYARITEYDDSDAVQNGFNALRDGFDAATGTLFSKNGNRYTAFSNTTQTDIKLKMLKDVLLDKTIVYEGNRRLTFTTAEIEETANIQAMRARGDYFLFNADTDRTDDNRDKSLITRAFNANSMINDDGTSLTLADIILEGNKENYNTRSNGGIVHVVSGRTLTITDGAILQNAKTSGNGGAVYANAESTVTMSGGTINGNNAENGAGIYLAQGSTLNLSGNPNFGGTDQNADGSLKGTEGNFVSKTFNDTDFKQGAKNGGKDYPVDTENSENRLVRQDIYLAGAAAENQALTSITLTGNLASTVPAGSIWVWAAGTNNTEPNHYYMLKQFAVLDSSFSGTVSDATYSAFRNARADADTDCGGDYLTGQSGDNIGSTRCIYWTGGFDFSFLKVDGFDAALAGATFKLYTSYTSATVNEPYLKGGEAVEAESSDGTDTTKFPDPEDNTKAQAKGTVFFSKVAPKDYYMIETTAPSGFADNTATIYKVTIASDGTATIQMKLLSEDDDKYVEAYKVQTEAAKAATDDAPAEPAKYQYHILNTPTIQRKVILKKVAATTYTPLSGARFRIFRADMSEITEGQPTTGEGASAVSKGYYESGASGVYFIGDLPEGRYYLLETVAPSGAASSNEGKVFVLTVDTNGVTQRSLGDDEGEILSQQFTGDDAVENLKNWLIEHPQTTERTQATGSGTTDTTNQ